MGRSGGAGYFSRYYIKRDKMSSCYTLKDDVGLGIANLIYHCKILHQQTYPHNHAIPHTDTFIIPFNVSLYSQQVTYLNTFKLEDGTLGKSRVCLLPGLY